MTCGIDLFDHLEAGHRTCDDPKHRAALARRADQAPAWSLMVRGHDGGGSRDFLDGTPINCGNGLELQATEVRTDDYGDFTVTLSTGVPVRYEVEGGIQHGQVILYTYLGGHQFRLELHRESMRFRRPRRD